MANKMVCEATVRDLIPLARLLQQEAQTAQEFARYYELQPDFNWQSYAKRKLARKEEKIFLAKADDAVAGFVDVRTAGYPQLSKSLSRRIMGRLAWRRYMPVRPLTWGVIEGCFVNEEFRRTGIGRSLVSTAVAWLADKSIERVELGVLVDNEAAQAFWNELGFRTFRMMMRGQTNASAEDAHDSSSVHRHARHTRACGPVL